MSKKSITDKVNEFLHKHDLFGKTFVIGFSGGYDSLCLLDILSKANLRLVAAHFNHGWRNESDNEENRCKTFCEVRKIEFYSERASELLKKTEVEARIARYEFFERVLLKFNADGIFTAHNYDDNAETLVYRMIKGTGVYGLQGIAEKRNSIYRPLLYCTREEIEAYCAENNLKPNIDSSNFDTKYRRNFIRHEILPKMAEINKDVKVAINTLSENAKIDIAVIEEYLKKISVNVVNGDKIDTQEFLKLSEAVRQRLLYSFLSKRLLEYDSKRIKEIIEFISNNVSSVADVKTAITIDTWLGVNSKRIVIYKDKKVSINEILIRNSGQYNFDFGELIIEECKSLPREFPKDSDGVAYVDLSGIEFPLVFRLGQSLDKIKPLGMNGSMELKKYLSSRKVEQQLRDSVPVLVKESNVLWVPYIGISNDIKVDKIPTHKLIWKEILDKEV